MKTIMILPAFVLGAASLALSTSVVAGTYTHHPIRGIAHGTGEVVSGVGHVAVGVVGGVAHGTAYVVKGVANTTKYVLTGGKTSTTHHHASHVSY